MGRRLGVAPVAAVGPGAHETPLADPLGSAVGVVEIGQAEGVAELVGEHADLDEAGLVAGEERLDGVVAHPDEPAPRGRVVGHVGRAPPALVDPPVRPDVGSSALAPELRMDEGDEVHVAVVVAGVGDPVGTVVVVDGEVGGGIGEIEEFLEVLPHAGVGAESVARIPRAHVGALVVGVVLGHDPQAVPVTDHVPGEGDVPVGDLVVVVGDRAGGIGAVEQLVLQFGHGVGIPGRVGELARDDGNVLGARHHHRVPRGGGAEETEIRQLAAADVLPHPARLLDPGPAELEGGAVLGHPVVVGPGHGDPRLGRVDLGPGGGYGNQSEEGQAENGAEGEVPQDMGHRAQVSWCWASIRGRASSCRGVPWGPKSRQWEVSPPPHQCKDGAKRAGAAIRHPHVGRRLVPGITGHVDSTRRAPGPDRAGKKIRLPGTGAV